MEYLFAILFSSCHVLIYIWEKVWYNYAKSNVELWTDCFSEMYCKG